MFSFLWRFVYSIYFYGVFVLTLVVSYWFGFLFCKKNTAAWRRLGLRAVRAIFFMAAVRTRVIGRENIVRGKPVIFAANHESFLDGLLIFAATGVPFVAITAPYQIFPSIVEMWFRRMGYIGIARDVFEELKYRDALGRKDAVKKCVALLKRGVSLLIFPEGTRELHRRLLPFHVGVARIAMDSRSPVVPMIIRGADRMFSRTAHLVRPTRLTLTIHPAVRLWEIAKEPIAETAYLEDIIHRHLPRSYFTKESAPHCPRGRRAAFFDLDGTLTRQNIYRLLVTRFLQKHVAWHDIAMIARLLFKKILLSHGGFFRYCVRLLASISVRQFVGGFDTYLARHAQEIFRMDILALLKRHQQKGNLVFVVSEEPREMLAPILSYLHVKGYGTPLTIARGKFTGTFAGKMLKDQAKRDCIVQLAKRYHIDLSKSYAYGNAWQDYAMLRTVRHAYLVNPPSDLKRRGKHAGFRVISS